MKRLLLVSMMLWNVLFWSCDPITPADDSTRSDYTCEGCHTTKAILDNVIDELNLDPPVEEEAAPG